MNQTLFKSKITQYRKEVALEYVLQYLGILPYCIFHLDQLEAKRMQ